MTDDVSWEAFGSYGADDYKTPNLDKMATEGVDLTIVTQLRSAPPRES